MMAKFERNRVLAATPKVVPSLPSAVSPVLRFLLAPEVIAEAQRFFRHINDVVAWPNIPAAHMVDFMEKHIIGKLAEQWPHVARADAHFEGLLVEVLRAFAANPKLAGWWKSPFIALLNGHPEMIRTACQTVLAAAGVPLPDAVESYEEEKPDLVLREAARHWQDRDEDEFEADCA
ncbi:hypothetical protein [Mesorhizobium sp. A623]